MPRFAANLSMLFGELALPDRIDAAAAMGFQAIEFQAPYAAPASTLAEQATARGLQTILLNLPNGPRAEDRGLGAMPGRETEFWEGFEQAIGYCRALRCGLARVVCGFVDDEAARPAMRATLIANLRRAAPVAAAAGVTLTLEPLNQVDTPGYFLRGHDEALAIIEDAGAPNVSLQFDAYHLHKNGVDAAAEAARVTGRYAHVQISQAPARSEPTVGEIDFPALFALFDRLGYRGWIGCEYRPSGGDTRASLAWARAYGIG